MATDKKELTRLINETREVLEQNREVKDPGPDLTEQIEIFLSFVENDMEARREEAVKFSILEQLKSKAEQNAEIRRCADKDDVEAMEKFLAEEDEKQEEGQGD